MRKFTDCTGGRGPRHGEWESCLAAYSDERAS
jgi:hypothetical protein